MVLYNIRADFNGVEKIPDEIDFRVEYHFHPDYANLE